MGLSGSSSSGGGNGDGTSSSTSPSSQEQQSPYPSSRTGASAVLHAKHSKRTRSTTTTKHYVRRAHHAGSWYDIDGSDLSALLRSYLIDATSKMKERSDSLAGGGAGGAAVGGGGDCGDGTAAATHQPRAVIAPHAGYSYSGPTAAYAYVALREALSFSQDVDGSGGIRTIVVLHPSHHVRLDGCAISGASVLETPLGNLQVDDELRTELLNTGKYTTMTRRDDEHEHSGEMQYPYIAQVLIDHHADHASSTTTATSSKTDDNIASHTIKVLPIMVGGIDTTKEKSFGKELANVMGRDDVFTVISSDFCHWGRRFGYTPPHDRDYRSMASSVSTVVGGAKRNGTTTAGGSSSSSTGGTATSTTTTAEALYQYIESLDRMGMEHIRMQDPGAFAEYLKLSRNTICGRHPIAVWLNSVKANEENGTEVVDVEFVEYAQSGPQIRSLNETSVSYASAVARRRQCPRRLEEDCDATATLTPTLPN